jgi:hypothetical protein
MWICALRRWVIAARIVFCVTLGTVACLSFSPLAQGAKREFSRADDRRDALLEERLAAGEFGPAIDAAQDLSDPTDRIRQLQQISAAQRSSRDFRGAFETARRIPDPGLRAWEGGAVARERSQSGGGSMADFTELIELITSTVHPDSWEEVGGPGSVREYRTGVHVDPNGLMRQLTREERTGALDRLGRRARIADLNDDLAQSSPLRVVSLKRLERAVSERLEAGRPVPETMRRLAGLTQIKYVLVYPAEREIVIAGPAERWRYDESGRAVGVDTGRPLLDLDDLVVVLRSFAPGGAALLGCSINTRDAHLKQVKEFVEASNRAGPLRPGQRSSWLKELQKRLGLQDVVVDGVPASTHVAQVLVEADYKMKLIGVAKLDGGPGIPSYFDLLRQAGAVRGAPLEALRWWLTMKYDAVLHSSDRLAFELKGSSVLVQSENQFVNAQGKHLPTGLSEPVNRQFAENFTRHYAELAEREPVFADLRNIFDMALVAALCRQERLHERADWEWGAFAPGGAYRPTEATAPKVIESVINHRVYGGKDIVVQVAGGVQADLAAVARDASLSQESAELGDLPRRARLPEARWWWDSGR